MPAVYQDRCDVSLYDAQYVNGHKVPIPQKIIDRILAALLRFKRICQDFGVRHDQIRIVATEATREALNSHEYREQIESKTGWKVDMLPKEEEGRVGAMGIASGFSSVKGLALDLGGGSIQMTWIISKDGDVEISRKGSVSFPYGAAALMNKLGTNSEPQAADRFQNELSSNFEQAIEDLEIPQSLTKDAENNGFTLYLSGGGFRGWGYVLMSMHAVKPYPIPTINGFRVLRSGFLPDSVTLPSDNSTFRVSSRRVSQISAVTFIITALTRSLPNLANVYFAQGGVREGLLFSKLSPSTRSQSPLVAATLPYAPHSTQALLALLRSAIPPLSPTEFTGLTLMFSSSGFLVSIIHLLAAHSSLPKDVRPAAALRSTTTGLIAGAHGISHEERALIALILCERWGGEISPSDIDFRNALAEIVGAEAAWWTKYVGRVTRGLGGLFPAGLIRAREEDKSTIDLAARWSVLNLSKRGSSDKTERVIVLDISPLEGEITEDVLTEWQDAMEKVGKKKNWAVDQHSTFGYRVEVQIKKK